MLRREVALPRTRYGALPNRGVDQHPNGIVDICAAFVLIVIRSLVGGTTWTKVRTILPPVWPQLWN